MWMRCLRHKLLNKSEEIDDDTQTIAIQEDDLNLGLLFDQEEDSNDIDLHDDPISLDIQGSPTNGVPSAGVSNDEIPEDDGLQIRSRRQRTVKKPGYLREYVA
jgi:hypothetical protein